MTIWDILITITILLWFGLMIYVKMSKRTIKDLIIDIRDLIKSMRNKND